MVVAGVGDSSLGMLTCPGEGVCTWGRGLGGAQVVVGTAVVVEAILEVYEVVKFWPSLEVAIETASALAVVVFEF